MSFSYNQLYSYFFGKVPSSPPKPPKKPVKKIKIKTNARADNIVQEIPIENGYLNLEENEDEDVLDLDDSCVKHLQSDKRQLMQTIADLETQLDELGKHLNKHINLKKEEKLKHLLLENARNEIMDDLRRVRLIRDKLTKEKANKQKEKMQAQRQLANLEDDLIRISVAHDDKRDECFKFCQEVEKLKRILAKQKFKFHITKKRTSSM